MSSRRRFISPAIRPWLLLLALWGGLATLTARAVVLDDLYLVSVPVSDRSAEARHAALVAAMGVLLIRLTGDAQAGALPGAEPLLASPERYVEQFRYRQREPEVVPEQQAGESTEGTAPVADEGQDEVGGAPSAEPVLELEVRFDGQALAQALRDQGLPLWGRERPALLLWLAVEDETGNRRLVAADDAGVVREAAEETARRRGLPLYFPLMDLEDRSRVEVADVWGGFVEQLAPASRRYPVQGLVLARVQRLAEGAWTGHFVLDFDGDRLEWQADGFDAAAVVAQGLGHLADELARRLAVQPGGVAGGETSITVEGVTGLEDYARVMAYLEGLTQVRGVRLDTVRPGALELVLEVDGGPRGLAQALAMGRVLEADGEAEGLYRLLP